jgi:hypothetical protein
LSKVSTVAHKSNFHPFLKATGSSEVSHYLSGERTEKGISIFTKIHKITSLPKE